MGWDAPVSARGEVAEWFKAAVLKTAVGASSPWVRIPLSPPWFADANGAFGTANAPLIHPFVDRSNAAGHSDVPN